MYTGPAGQIHAALGGLNSSQFLSFATNQAFIAFGFAVAAAADLKLGACPMGGFEPEKVKIAMNLPENETPVAFLAVGVAPDESDPRSNPYPKTRFPMDYLVKHH